MTAISTILTATALFAASVPCAANATAHAPDAPEGKGDTPLSQHSGGTDAQGCHKNHKTGEYHCHNRK